MRVAGSHTVQQQVTLDHIALNAKFQQPQAAALFTALGFQLTPVSQHTLGSINQLIVFPGCYLEIIGLPSGVSRVDIEAGHLGLDGIVLHSDDITASAAQLAQAGFAVAPPQFFSRDVVIDEQSVIAKFAAARLLPGQFQSARIYACQHFTPQYVWHPPWCEHPNGALRLLGLTLVSDNPEQLAAQYQRLGQVSNLTLQFVDSKQWRAEQHWHHDMHPASELTERALALQVAVRNCRAVIERAEPAGLPLRESPRGVWVALEQFATVLEFIEQRD